MTSHGDAEGKAAASGLKMFTWNVNGIRSFEDFPERLQKTDADIICIQETKVRQHFKLFSILLMFILLSGDSGNVDSGCGHHPRLHIQLLLLTPEVGLQRSGHRLQDARHAHRGGDQPGRDRGELPEGGVQQ